MRDQDIVAWIVKRFEKGFSNHPADRGGPTKFGISQRLLEARYERDVDVEEIRALTFIQAVGILIDEFVAKPRLYEIDDDLVRLQTIDFAINSGAATAIRALQRIRGVDDDGVWGPITAQAVNAGGDAFSRWFAQEIIAYRIRFLGRLITDDHTQAANAAGWMDRCATLLTVRLPLPDLPDLRNV